MLKVLIADDEAIIRKGIADCINWSNYVAQLLRAARNGAEALATIRSMNPDVCLIDINMPVLNGLELMEKIRECSPQTVCIIISGYDNFSYAQKAIRLGAFDYILKPVDENELVRVIESAVEHIHQRESQRTRISSLENELKEHLPIIWENLIRNCLTSREPASAISAYQENSYPMPPDNLTLLVIPADKCLYTGSSEFWNADVNPLPSMRALFEQLFSSEAKIFYLTSDDHRLTAVIEQIPEDRLLYDLSTLEDTIKNELHYTISVYYEETKNGIHDLRSVYDQLLKTVSDKESITPVIGRAKDYIDKHYIEKSLKLNAITDRFNISAGHFSRLFKKELGVSFSAYVEQKRIQHATRLLLNGNYKIYEIAEKVGYSSQHYFCAVFKNIMGCSPSDYQHMHISDKK